MKRAILVTFLLVCVGEMAFAGGISAGPSFLKTGIIDNSGISLMDVLLARINESPIRLVATLIFCCAILHTFIVLKFQKWAEAIQAREKSSIGQEPSHGGTSIRAAILHLLSEVEVVFCLWAVPLLIVMGIMFGHGSVCSYLDGISYLEPTFVVVIMTIASSYPIIYFTEKGLSTFAKMGGASPAAWWFSILTLGPLLGSVITEPAAMTISAMLLAKQFYELSPSRKLCYATIGLLFVNVSVGGALTHFAAPPILMIAIKWNWTTPFIFTQLGWHVLIAIITSNLLYYFIFKSEFKALHEKKKSTHAHLTGFPKHNAVPFPIIMIHIGFLVWSVLNLHNLPLLVGGFLFFIGFTQITKQYQHTLSLRPAMMVGFFLAGLVTHGGLQQWWLEPVLNRLSENILFLGATLLTSFNDNAAITYLASLVPDFAHNINLQVAVVEGAIAGGGLTVIANAPNPAGQSILSKYFGGGLSPIYLFLGALLPTIVISSLLRLL